MRKVLVLLLACLLPAAPVGALAAEASDDGIVGYARECREKVAALPAFDCMWGEEIPITVNGAPPAGYQPGMTCDRPSLLPNTDGDGQCVPHSRALVLRDDEKAQISVYCRQTRIRPAGTDLFDEINVIVHGLETGSTCWYQTQEAEGGINGRRVPAPDDPALAPSFWKAPHETAKGDCVSCHDSDPFMYSPFYAQTKALPSDAFGKYANDIGAAFRAWAPPRGISTPGNTCTTCHRMGDQKSCSVTMYQSFDPELVVGLNAWGKRFPQSHWMPPGDLHSKAQWDVIFRESIAKLETCCKQPDAPGCIVQPMTDGQR